jgi:transposase
MNTVKNQNEVNVGVDTGQDQLDIYVQPLDVYFIVSNDDEGISEAVKKLIKYSPTRVVIEATGRLEHAFVLACAKAKLPIVVANPAQVKSFAKAIGQLAKTDKLDARLIAHYGEVIKPSLSQLKPELMQLMSDLLSRRKQIVCMQTMEKNRLQRLPKTLTSSIKPVLTVFKNQLAKIDTQLLKLIENQPQYQSKNAIVQSMPGVGNVVAFNLLSNMPELGYISNKQAAALVGVAPINRDSGSFQGQRRIRGGRHQIRTVMYMAMMSGIQCNPVFKRTYERLVAAGKPKKTAIIACVRKMIVILNSMVRDGTPWNPNMAK